MKVSVIIPVFNAMNNLETLLDALSLQDYEGEFEVILVDDCSSDSSYNYLKKLEQDIARNNMNEKKK